MSQRLTKAFNAGPAYVGFITAGDGGLQQSFDAIMALIAGGITVLEVGVPFSDPIADGTTIQQACTRALANGTTLNDVLALIKKVRALSDIPIVLFSYFNPILIAGDNFYAQAKQAGVDGCLVVDLPLEEAEQHHQACINAKIDPVLLISPSSSLERIKQITQHGKGMLYYVCRNGTTGVKAELPDNFSDKIKAIKSVSSLPVVAGFGIANRDMAKRVLAHADGFVVGSLFVNAIANGTSSSQLTALAQSVGPS